MALIDKGADEEFYENLAGAGSLYYMETGNADEFPYAIEWLIKDAHKSDIGVIHRMIRAKLGP